ncbi:MAG: PP2C family serine/threonine-protein phosphatase [Chloroflexota bacterium]
MNHKFEWTVLGASVAGTSHAKSGKPCHDAHLVLQLEAGELGSVLIMAVADGAGSAAYAHEGAMIAVDVAVSSIAEAVEGLAAPLPERSIRADDADWRSSCWKDAVEKLMQDAFQASHDAIDAHAKIQQHSIRDYHTTLVMTIVTAEAVVTGMIGDGAVVAERNVVIEQNMDEDEATMIAETIAHSDSTQQTELVSLCQPQRGEYANSTYFLTQPTFTEHVTIDIHFGQYEAIALLTDGLLPLAMNIAKNRPHQPFFEPLFKFVQSVDDDDDAFATAQTQLADFFDSARVNQRTDDDKTLVIAVRR